MLSFDQVCNPVSMLQDTFSLSEFILGPFEEENSEETFGKMLKTEQDIKYETVMDEDDYQGSAADIYESSKTPLYSPCNYMYQRAEPSSPASCSSECSSASSTPNTYPLPYTYNYGQDRSTMPTTNNLQYSGYIGYQGGRKRKQRDEELPVEEREKRRIRRERNKLAALRCRTRRRERIEVLEKETEDIESQNNDVRSDISCLQAQLKQLEQMLKEHQCDKNV